MDGNHGAELSVVLRGLEPAAARRLLLRELCREVAEFLGRPVDSIDPRTGFVDLGFDSLRAVDFRGRLERLLGVELRSTLLFDQPDCERLSDWLLAELGTRAPAPVTSPAVAASPGAAAPEIAIVGYACRFPGQCDSAQAFWELLDQGECAIGEPPPGRWPIDELYSPDPSVPGRIYTRRGGFLPAIEQFDAAFFGISPVEAAMLDPQQRLLLEVAWETLEDAGVPPDRLRDLLPGVFVGMRASEYFQSQCARLPEDADAYYATGNAVSTAAGRLSYFLGFRGPCFALDTACSGSLVAVHQAMLSIRAGECRAALAGGVNTLVDPLSSVGLCRARMLSPDGLCKTFDARADGYVRAEGCGLVLLVRRDDAERLGLPIRAIVRGSAINQDGRTGGLTVPNGPSQEAVVRAALRDAGLGPDDLDYVEAHGTGTALGDPIEVGALDAVFAGRRDRGRPLLVGSVKTNLGHLEAAAGISGLLKVLLALEHERLPRHLHLQQPNPHIDWDATEIEVTTGARPWPRGERPRRAGVSSFGFSGTNAHVIVEEGTAPAPLAPARRYQPVVLSAATEAALRQQAARWADAVSAPDAPPLAHVAFTAGHGRTHFAHRLGVVASDAVDLANGLRSHADGVPTGVVTGQAARTPPRIAFLFSGQGAQRPGAGRELYDEEPVFRRAIERMGRVFDRLREVPLTEVLFGDDAERLRRTDYTQPALFALQFALAELWRAFGVQPSLVLGHSVGEIAAAAAAGVMTPEDGLRLCAARGTLMVQHCRPGAMLAVFLASDRLEALLGPLPQDCAIAAINGPAETVLSGSAAALDELAQRLQRRDVRCQRLQVSHAFHSPMLAPMLAPFRRFVERLPLQPARLPLFACRPEGSTAAVEQPEHWLRHVAEPVHFATALGTAAAQADVLVEIGPSPVLLALAARALPRAMVAIPSLRAGMPERAQLLRGVVQLHVQGAEIDFAAVTAADAPRRARLPSYPFERQRFWLRHQAATPRSAVHPLLGAPLPTLLLQPHQRLFEGALAERSPAFLEHHRVYDRALLPAAGLIECALAAGAHAFSSTTLELRDVVIQAPMWLDPQPMTTQLLLDGGEDGAGFRISRRDGESWPVHASGTVALCAPGQKPPPLPDATDATQQLSVEQLYDDYVAAGLGYGPAFRAVRKVRRGDGTAAGSVALPAELRAEAGPFVVHPVLLDACFQIAGLAMAERIGAATWLPVGVERVVVLRPPGTEGSCRARLRSGGSDRTRVIDVVLLDQTGRTAVAVQGLQLLRAEAHVLAAVDSSRWLHGCTWQRRPRPELTSPPGRWVVTAPELHDGARALATQLGAAGASAEALPLAEALPALERAGTSVRGLAFDATAPTPDNAAAVTALLAQLVRAARAAAAMVPPARLVIVTAGAVAADVLDRVPHAAGAALWGFARTLVLEHPELRPLCVDRDQRTGLDLVARELLLEDDEDMIALRSDQRFAARLFAGTARPGEVALPPAGGWRLRCQEYGRLERLVADAAPARSPGPNEVEIDVAACGLNFKDVLHALGLLRQWSEEQGVHHAGDQPLGFECSGTVLAIGADVEGLSVGDRVVACADDLLRNRAVVDAARVLALPPQVEPIAAAGLPTVFATVLYGLVELAQIRAGDRVLVHAAAGGVGLAALQVLEHLGCEVFVTSSPQKAGFLADLGFRRWADSRGDFASELRPVVADGVDVVLNSLTGDAIAQSLSLLRQGGRFVEIGKRGIWSPERMARQRPDVRYHTFDLAEATRADPALLPRLLRRLQQGLVQGWLRPVHTTPVPIQRAPEAFAAMAKGRHVGKIVLTLPRALAIRADRTYVLSGGTGAVARAVARALVDHGARHLALIARSDLPHKQLEEFAVPAHVRLFQADVGKPGQLALAVRELRAAMPPVAGVVHAAGALHDALLDDLDEAAIREVLQPKVDGARLLAALLDDGQLDFFVATSSMAAWLGNQGQAAYGAANAWLDAFCTARAQRCRRSLSVAFGPWAEAGMAARLSARERGRLRDLGIDAIPPTVGAALFVQTLLHHERSLGVLPVRWPAFVRQFVDRVPPLLRALPAVAARQHAATGGAVDAGSGLLLQELQALPAAERTAALAQRLRAELAQVLGFASGDQVDAARTFGELGVDSLLAVEIRTRLGRALAVPLPATLLFDHPDIDRLASHLVSLLPPADGEGPAPGSRNGAAPEAAPDADPTALARELEAQVRAMEERS
ncbi:MAG: SDR family NAD(P)-dependent oxidoreductase [Planctomycetota bacterium]